VAKVDHAAVLRAPAEVLHAEELKALAKADKDPRPPGWKLSPRAVRSFICGSDKPSITRKFFGDDAMVERAIITLAGNRGLLLVGEPGTAKSMLSELLAAAISGASTNTIQGSAGTTEDQIKYSWNYALLLAEGPSLKALVEAPLYVGMKQGLPRLQQRLGNARQQLRRVLCQQSGQCGGRTVVLRRSGLEHPGERLGRRRHHQPPRRRGPTAHLVVRNV
jgi:hypothetical protein